MVEDRKGTEEYRFKYRNKYPEKGNVAKKTHL